VNESIYQFNRLTKSIPQRTQRNSINERKQNLNNETICALCGITTRQKKSPAKITKNSINEQKLNFKNETLCALCGLTNQQKKSRKEHKEFRSLNKNKILKTKHFVHFVG
jgi:uncharacterized Zn finger protein (UPF0148 family)